MNTPNLIAQKADFGSSGLDPRGYTGSGGLIGNFDLDNPISSTEQLLSKIIGFLTLLGGLIFIVMFLIGIFQWISGGDDSAKIQKARDLMVQGVIGLIVMVAGYAIIGLIGSVVGFDILNPAANLRSIFNLGGKF